nr:unknown [Zea mays]
MKEKYGATKKLAKVASNLPFNVSTEVVKLLLPMGDVFSVVVLMLQDETAVRLADASIQSPEYRSINVFVDFYSEPEYKFRVDRENFFPRPKVDGAVISFKLKNAEEYPPVSSPKSFFSMVSSGSWGHGVQKLVPNLNCFLWLREKGREWKQLFIFGYRYKAAHSWWSWSP